MENDENFSSNVIKNQQTDTKTRENILGEFNFQRKHFETTAEYNEILELLEIVIENTVENKNLEETAEMKKLLQELQQEKRATEKHEQGQDLFLTAEQAKNQFYESQLQYLGIDLETIQDTINTNTVPLPVQIITTDTTAPTVPSVYQPTFVNNSNNTNFTGPTPTKGVDKIHNAPPKVMTDVSKKAAGFSDLLVQQRAQLELTQAMYFPNQT